VCCQKCGKPIVGFGKKQLCYFCLNNSTQYFNRIISVFNYEGKVKDAVKSFKSKGYKGHRDLFCDCLYARICEEYPYLEFDMICSPPSRKRNGFDQTKILGIGLEKRMSVLYQNNTFRFVKKTRKQSDLKLDERFKNMKNSMIVDPKINIDGKSILLVDDVCTTRSTITECSRALKAKGARMVYAVTVATVKNIK
jgi:ComF family protein